MAIVCDMMRVPMSMRPELMMYSVVLTGEMLPYPGQGVGKSRMGDIMRSVHENVHNNAYRWW